LSDLRISSAKFVSPTRARFSFDISVPPFFIGRILWHIPVNDVKVAARLF
jgi:hypothetical protein